MRHRYVSLLFVLAIYWLSNLAVSAQFEMRDDRSITAFEAYKALPRAHTITGVHQHKQLNGLDCGPASVEIVFDYWGIDIDQKAIADVARTSSIGTWTWDIVRTGHFSYMSTAQGRFFPHDAPTAGFPERPVGYASFSYSSNGFWWADLKGLIASDIPVILLMKYAPDDSKGHYRVIVGYDENKGVVYFMDPWDRGMGKLTNPDGTLTWTMADFESAWNYAEYGTIKPYWGAVIMPWSISLHTTRKTSPGSVISVTAVITYPCPKPFDCSAYPAYNAYAEISLPPGMKLLGGSTIINIGGLSAGKSCTVSWNVKLEKDGTGSSITISAGGTVSDSVPEANWKGNGVYYPPYGYTDGIGGVMTITL